MDPITFQTVNVPYVANNCDFPHKKVKWLTISRIKNQRDEIRHFWNPSMRLLIL